MNRVNTSPFLMYVVNIFIEYPNNTPRLVYKMFYPNLLTDHVSFVIYNQEERGPTEELLRVERTVSLLPLISCEMTFTWEEPRTDVLTCDVQYTENVFSDPFRGSIRPLIRRSHSPSSRDGQRRPFCNVKAQYKTLVVVGSHRQGRP